MGNEGTEACRDLRWLGQAAVSSTLVPMKGAGRPRPSFERLDIGAVDESELNAFPDRTIYQTLSWLRFIGETQGAEPVIAALRQGDVTLGYFTGLLVKKFGMRILGSPFLGWHTLYMGFNLLPGVPRRVAIKSLEEFAFQRLKCRHLELMDRRVEPEDYLDLGFRTWMLPGYELDLRPSEDQIFANFRHVARTNIRKAADMGVTIEEAHDEDFADEHFRQLEHVYAVHGLTIPYTADRIHAMIRHVYPTGRLLLLRARNSAGICIATALFAAMNDTAYYHSAASWRAFVRVRPNEAIVWYAIKYWKKRGVLVLDLCGGGDFKKKYGGHLILVPWIRKSSNRVISFLRSGAESAFYWQQRLTGFLRRAAFG